MGRKSNIKPTKFLIDKGSGALKLERSVEELDEVFAQIKTKVEQQQGDASDVGRIETDMNIEEGSHVNGGVRKGKKRKRNKKALQLDAQQGEPGAENQQVGAAKLHSPSVKIKKLKHLDKKGNGTPNVEEVVKTDINGVVENKKKKRRRKEQTDENAQEKDSALEKKESFTIVQTRTDTGVEIPLKGNEIDVIFAQVKEEKKKERIHASPEGSIKSNLNVDIGNNKKRKRPKKKTSKNAEECLGKKRTEEGYRVYREDELNFNRKDAGGTPLCPFDCDCCF